MIQRNCTLLILMLALLGIALPAFALGDAEVTTGDLQEGPTVVATTAWTAAFALAAGAQSIQVLAPYELRHPPEHELAPSDVLSIGEADYVIFAGYERMVERVRAAAQSDAEVIQIATAYDLATIRQSIATIAEHLGTAEAASKAIAELEAFYDGWRQELTERNLAGKPVIAHAFQAPLAQELGLDVVGVFGPAPLEATQIARLSELKAAFLIDNWHNDVGRPLRETVPDMPVVTFINFPGHENTRSLLDVLEYNKRELSNANLGG